MISATAEKEDRIGKNGELTFPEETSWRQKFCAARHRRKKHAEAKSISSPPASVLFRRSYPRLQGSSDTNGTEDAP